MKAEWLTSAMNAFRRGDHGGALRACALAPDDLRSQGAAHALRASTLMKLGRTQEALDEIDAAFALGVESAELWRLGAEIHAERGELETALDWIDRALRTGQGSPSRRILEKREQIVIGMNLLSGLYEHFELVVALQPQSLEARERLIKMLLELRLWSLAEEHLDIAVAQNPQRASLLIDQALVCIERQRAAAAITALERALAEGVGAEERLRIAMLFVGAGALEQALRTVEEGRALYPDSAEMRVQSGFFALWQGDIEAARTCQTEVMENAPGLARLRAAIAFVEGRYDEAVEHANHAVDQNDKDAEAYSLRAAALWRLGRHDEARQSALTAGHATSEWLPVNALLLVAAEAGSRPRVVRQDIGELFELLAAVLPAVDLVADEYNLVASAPVLTAIDVGLRRISGNFSATPTFVSTGSSTWLPLSRKAPARMNCVRVANFIQLRPVPWVVERVAELAADYPRTPYIHTHVAELWLWFGDYAACESECRKALALSKTDGTRWAWVGLGAGLMLQERYAEALEVFAQSEQLMQPGAPLLAYRGETLRRCGDLGAARHDLTRSLDLAPARVSAWINLGLIAFAEGDVAGARDMYERLHTHVAQLMRHVERDLQRQVGRADTPDAMVASFEHALRVMRGNRSTSRITYFLADGRARVLNARTLPAREV